MGSQSIEMKWIQLLSPRDTVPENYTGIIDYWYPLPNEATHFHKFSYTRILAIRGRQYKLRDRAGKITYYRESDISRNLTTFEEMFESLSTNDKEIVIWNLDVWR